MPSRRLRLGGSALAACLAFGSSAMPPAHASSADVRRQLEALTVSLQKAEAEKARLDDSAAGLARKVARAEVTLKSLERRAAERTRAAYMGDMGATTLEAMLTSDSPGAALERISMVEAVTRSEGDTFAELRAHRRRLKALTRELDGLRRQAQSRARQMAADSRRLTALFSRLSGEERAAAERAEAAADAARARRNESRRASRARAASNGGEGRAPSTSGNFSCLVGPTNAYSDTWGAPRSGGRRHKGTDVFAPYGSPAYAVTDGVITRLGNGGAGGITLYLRGNNGDVYYYAHNSRNLVRAGQRVSRGEVIARVGQSGNAQGTSPHVHFEVHPGGGSPVNPYPFVRRTCG